VRDSAAHTDLARYGYDANGNRTSVTDGAGTRTASHDDQDRLLSEGTTSYRYTANGELRESIVGTDTTRYGYDELGNLLAVDPPAGSTIGYVVDGANRRVGRTVDGVLRRTGLFQDGLNVVAELDSVGTLLSRFVYASRGHVPDYLVTAGGDSTYRLVTDHLGSVRLVVNVATGWVAQRLRYGPWGELEEDTRPGFQPFGYAGGRHEPATGLVRFGARDYDASVGRWTSKDPAIFLGRQSHLYSYVYDSPVNVIDISGLAPINP
jgi:RHS repeat-associated protein